MRYGAKVALIIFVILILVILLVLVPLRLPGLFVNWSVARRSKRKWMRLLDAAGVERYLAAVHSMRETSAREVRKGDLHIIGNASYIGGFDHKMMVNGNAELWAEFSSLYIALAKCIAEQLQCGVRYEPSLCPLPGFHIFSASGYLASGWHVASLHVDLQYLKVDWGDLDVDTTRTISFTLPLSLPPDAGLYFLDLRYKQNAGLLAYRKAKKERVEYKLGHLYIHDGHQFHMIAPHKPGTERITLQGHGIYSRRREQYILYW